MKQLKKVKKLKAPLIKRVKSFWPERLPQGMTQFSKWVDEVAELSGLPVNDRLRKVIGVMILQIPPNVSMCAKRHIVNRIRKAAANQVAAEAIDLVDEKEKAQSKGSDAQHPN
jgi:hypothetical protein